MRSVASLAPGSRLGHYVIGAPLGAGGMGEVCEAEDTRLRRRVALKVVRREVATDPIQRARLEREATAAAALNHPGIVTVHSLEEHEGVLFITMELIEGPTLAEALPPDGLPVDRLLPLAVQLADALAAAHAAGVVHRDLKPGNVMLPRKGGLKVLEFGLSRLDAGAESQVSTITHLTADGALLGTAPYMAPEQIEGHSADARSDIFALGVILFEMATGRRPFLGATPFATLSAIVSETPSRANAVNPAVPEELAAIIDRCLSKDPAQRTQSAAELRAQLEQLARTLDSGRLSVRADSHALVERLATTRRLLANHRRAGVVVALVVVVAAVALASWFSRGPSAPPSRSAGAGEALARTSRLVVLPFENVTQRSEEDWLAGAFSDAITTGLQPIRNLVLLTRETVVQEYGRRSLHGSRPLDPADVRRVTESLDVRYYVHGSFQRIGDQLRVTARLVEASTGVIKAQASATETMGNIFRLQDDVTRKLAAAFDTVDGEPMSGAGGTQSLEAYQAVTEARGLYAQGRFQAALPMLQRAVALDPSYARAWAELGKVYARLAAPSAIAEDTPIERYRREALTAARRALAAEPALYDAHIALALASRESSLRDQWRTAAQRAIDLNPRQAEAYVLLGNLYAEPPSFGCNPERDGRLADSYYRTALRIDPTIAAYYRAPASNLTVMGRIDDALQVLDDGLRRYPGNRLLLRGRAMVLVSIRKFADAERAVLEAVGGATPTIEERLYLAAARLAHGDLAEASDTFNAALAAEPASWVFLHVASYYFAAGERSRAAATLEKLLARDGACAAFVANTKWPLVVPLASDTQIRAVVRKFER